MRRIAAVLALCLAAPAPASPPDVRSAYTKLVLDRCIEDKAKRAPASQSWRCPGYRGISLFVQNGDERYDVDAGAEDADALWAKGFDYPGGTVEWRLARGVPFAIIYRLVSSGEGPRTSILAVESIGRRGRAGCRVAMIPGSDPAANRKARAAADRLLNTKVACLRSS